MKFKLSIALLSILLVSCTLSDQEKKDALPQSTGRLAEVIVVMNKSALTKFNKQFVRDVFGTPVPGIHPEEPQFKVIFVPETEFDGYFKKHHNLFFLVTRRNMDRMSPYFGSKNIGKVDQLIRNDSVLGFERDEIWAKRQFAFFVLGKDTKETLKKMGNRKDEILAVASRHEKETGQRNIFTRSIKRDKFYKETLEKKGYAIRKPSSYRVAIDNDDFVWLRKETSKFDYGVFMYSTPYSSEKQWELDGLISARSKFMKKYVPGEVDGSYMSVDKEFPLVINGIDYKGKYAKEIRGWWTVEGDFMGGPFVSKSVYDKARERIVTVEGFVYGPNKSKARHMRELEIVLNTLKIND